MAAPPPGADVQRRQPTAAGRAVTEGSLRAPFPREAASVPRPARRSENGERLADRTRAARLDGLGERAEGDAHVRVRLCLQNGPARVGGLA